MPKQLPQQPKPRRTQAERTRVSREKIIQAATALFGEQGYRGATMKDIARAANLTGPGLLHHFPSKSHVLMAVLAERDRVDKARFSIAENRLPSEPLATFERLMAHNATLPGLVQLFTTLIAESIQSDQPGHDYFLTRYTVLRSNVTDAVRRSQARGEIRMDIDADNLSVMIVAMMDGLQIQWLYAPEHIDLTSSFNAFAQMLMTGKGKRLAKRAANQLEA
jgi:AcrR family transcriptional regulator